VLSRALSLLVRLKLDAHTAEAIIAERGLVALLLRLMSGEEYLLARNATQIFRNMSVFMHV